MWSIWNTARRPILHFIEVLVLLVGLSTLLTDLSLPAAVGIVMIAFGATAIWLWAVSGRSRESIAFSVLTVFSMAVLIAIFPWPSSTTRSATPGELAAARLVHHELLVSELALRDAAGDPVPGTVLPLATEEWVLHREVLAAAMSPGAWEKVALYYDLAAVANENPPRFVGNGRRLVRDLLRQLGPALISLAGYAGLQAGTT